MEEKVTVFMLIPTSTSTAKPQNIIDCVKRMVGTLNCEQADDACALRIDTILNDDQRNEIINTCKKVNYTGLFIIAPRECENIKDTYIEL